MNTTFKAKQAINYMLDGLICLDKNNLKYQIDDQGYLYIDEIWFDGQIARFLTYLKDENFRLEGAQLKERYKPEIIWTGFGKNPIQSIETDIWYDDKEDFINKYEKGYIKVLKWQVELFPKDFEDCK